MDLLLVPCFFILLIIPVVFEPRHETVKKARVFFCPMFFQDRRALFQQELIRIEWVCIVRFCGFRKGIRMSSCSGAILASNRLPFIPSYTEGMIVRSLSKLCIGTYPSSRNLFKIPPGSSHSSVPSASGLLHQAALIKIPFLERMDPKEQFLYLRGNLFLPYPEPFFCRKFPQGCFYLEDLFQLFCCLVRRTFFFHLSAVSGILPSLSGRPQNYAVGVSCVP